jgi:hypothetical protein
MVYAAEVLERLARDVPIVIKNFSLSPMDNLHSILGDDADAKSELGSLSEVAHFSELIAERRSGSRSSGASTALSSAKGRAASGSTLRITHREELFIGGDAIDEEPGFTGKAVGKSAPAADR